jgi:hypothetical protein
MRNSQNTADQLLEHYEQGRLTAQGLILTMLSMSSKQRLTRMLGILPAELLKQLKDFVAHYDAETQVFRGPRPRIEAIRFVRQWFRYATRIA